MVRHPPAFLQHHRLTRPLSHLESGDRDSIASTMCAIIDVLVHFAALKTVQDPAAPGDRIPLVPPCMVP